MKKHTASIIGHFADNSGASDGQTVKTRTLYNALTVRYGNETISKHDTYGWKKQPLKLLAGCINAAKNSENVIILPAHNGVLIFMPLFCLLKLIYKTKVHYMVIGDWLVGMANQNYILRKLLGYIDAIYIETTTGMRGLKSVGIQNVEIIPNFKSIGILSIQEVSIKRQKKPLKVCTFSRVLYEKGIEDAINVVTRINTAHGKVVYELDIYGKIDANYEDRFMTILKSSDEYIRYCGIVDYDKSVEVLKGYYVLLFPTHFATEGIPGTIIDAYAAGLPVVASKWASFSDIIEESVTGFGYDMHDVSSLLNIMECPVSPKILADMKRACLAKASQFTPDTALQPLYDRINMDKRS